MARSKPSSGSEHEPTKVVATNRRARRDYEIIDEYEAGLVLVGSEVKSLRESKVTLTESYARMADGELWLQSLHIAPYSHAAESTGHDPDRPKKLLLHRGELNRIKARLEQDRLTMVPFRSTSNRAGPRCSSAWPEAAADPTSAKPSPNKTPAAKPAKRWINRSSRISVENHLQTGV